jgi:RNA polymerase sporulation-specific sigma factor
MNTDIKVKDYDKLIYSIINKYSLFGEIDDLYQVGMLGLLKACENYNSDFNTKFSTYAHTYILGEVLKYIRDNKSVRVNRDLVRLSSRVEKAREILSQKLMRKVTNGEIAHFLEIDEELVDEAVISSNFVKSLDYELNDEGREMNLYDSIKYEENGYSSELIDLKDSLSSLEEEEKRIIQYRYFDDRTQSDISQELGMSQVQVSRSEAKILKKLKSKLS